MSADVTAAPVSARPDAPDQAARYEVMVAETRRLWTENADLRAEVAALRRALGLRV
jgi:hypothetical protein